MGHKCCGRSGLANTGCLLLPSCFGLAGTSLTNSTPPTYRLRCVDAVKDNSRQMTLPNSHPRPDLPHTTQRTRDRKFSYSACAGQAVATPYGLDRDTAPPCRLS